MGALAKTDAALEAALIALGMSEEEAQFALRDMLIEEVSYVDRAANKRRFLVVKSAGGSMGKTIKKDAGTADKDLPMTLPTAVKEGLLRVLTESLERLVSAVEMVKGAEEVSEADGVAFPDALGTEIGTIADLLGGALSQYSSPMSQDKNEDGTPAGALKAIAAALSGVTKEDGTVDAAALAELVTQLGALLPAPAGAAATSDDPTATTEAKADDALAQVLAQAGEIAAALSEKAGTEEDLSAETVAGVRQLAAMLNEVVAQYPEPGAEGAAKAAPATTPAPDATAAPTAAPADVEKAGRKMSAARLKQLKGAVDALAKLISELETDKAEKRLAMETAQPDPAKGPYGSLGTGGSDDDTQAGPAQAADVDALAEVMKRLTSLQKSVTEIVNTPDAPASRREPEPSKVTKTEDSNANGKSRRRGGPWVW